MVRILWAKIGVLFLAPFSLFSIADNGLSTSAPICQTLHCIYVSADASDYGNGSADAPYNNLNDVEENSREGDVIVVLNAQTPLEGGIQLKDRQQLLGQFYADPNARAELVDCSQFPVKECRRQSGARPMIATTDDSNLAKIDGDAVRFAEGGYNVVRGIHFTETIRFAVLVKNASGVLADNIYENTGQTELPERAYLPCELEVIDPQDTDFTQMDDNTVFLKSPRDELGCWMWPAAFPGDILGEDRGNKLFFSNIAVASVGVLANKGKHSVRLSNSIFRNFTAGRVSDLDGASFGFAEGAEAILLSTDGDAHVNLNINRVDIKNDENQHDERGPRVANCTYAAIFTQHHDNSSARVRLRNGGIREIGGCDGLNNHIGFLPGVKSGDFQVRLLDSNGDGEYAVGPQHTVKLDIHWLNFHIVNAFDPVQNGANKFTDAFEPIISEHVDALTDSEKRSQYSLRMFSSTLKNNAGNGLEFRFGADRIERIPVTTPAEVANNQLSTGPLSLDARVRIRNSCFFNNAQADDMFSEGDNAINGRDNQFGRDYHNVHVYFPNPEDLSYRIDARRNFWGVRQREDFYSQFESEAIDGSMQVNTEIVAIYSNDLGILPPQSAPVQSSSFMDLFELDQVFDSRNPKLSAIGCYRGPR